MITQKLSTGVDSTLGEWKKLAIQVFGEKSNAVKFLEDKIAASPNGEKEPVVAPEEQLLYVLGTIHSKGGS